MLPNTAPLREERIKINKIPCRPNKKPRVINNFKSPNPIASILRIK